MSKKRKHDQVEPDAIPARDDGPEPDQSTPAKKSKSKGQSRQEKSERRAKKKKLDTKEKRSDKKDRSSEAVTGEEDKEEGGAGFFSKKKKKTKSTDEQQNGDAETESKAPKVKKEKVKKTKKSKDESDQPEGASSSSSSARFIVFVGNLPFTATAAQVQDHFVKLAPSSVRLSTDKTTGKGKGFAFVEFDGYDKMKTCLKLYHHSIFDPEAKGKDKTNASQDPADFDAKKKAGRRINVELTAGGGGKQSKGRKEKIRTKNIKLDEERERTRVKERAELDEAARKKRSQPQTGANAAQVDNGSIHPSRLAQMKH